jgi:hypothetical protein
MSKKMLPVPMPIIAGIIIVLFVVIGGGFLAYKKFGSKTASQSAQAPVKRKITEPQNTIPQSDRPFVEVIPVDAHNLVVAVNEVKKAASTLDFDMEYQTGTNLEGFSNQLPLDSLPAKTKPLLLGSCSAGGACTYNTDIQSGDIVMKFSGSETYVLKQDWKYVDNAKKETAFSSKDGFFQITSKDLASQRLFIIYNTPGYPGNPGNVISEAYVMSSAAPFKGKASLTMRAKEDASSAVIMGYDGQSWKEFKGKVDGKSITADVDLMPVYVVVKK